MTKRNKITPAVAVYIKEHVMFPLIAMVFALALTGCTKDSFDSEGIGEGVSNAIAFGTASQATTRSKGLETLEGSMKVYSAKLMTATFKYEKAMGNYAVWNTSNNPSVAGEWDYVGAAGDKKTIVKGGAAGATDNFTLTQDQVQKYWDYKSTQYIFWSVAPYSNNVTYNVSTADDITNGTVTSATINGIGGHLTANNTTTPNNYPDYYVSRPEVVAKGEYGSKDGNDPVTFEFDRLYALVRVGIYETIPSYKVKEVIFYNNDDTPVGGQNIVFNRDVAAFVGGTGGTATINYNNIYPTSWDVVYSGLTQQKWIQFGRLYDEGMADPTDYSGTYSYMLKLWGTDGDMSPLNLYFKVLPTPASLVSSDKPITLKMDFTLESEDGVGEKIHVKGVTGTVPLTFSTWEPNHAYSYVFKLTEEALTLKKIEFDAEASNITVGETIHNEDVDEP